jgi:hypothetical protein
MSRIFKDQAQLEAERIAEERGVDFFALPLGEQCEIYLEAQKTVTERLADRGDWLRDRAKEGG